MKQSPLPMKAEQNRHPLFKDQIISKEQQLPLHPEKVIRNSTSNYQTQLHKFYDNKINNDMLSEDKIPRNARSFRQDVNHVKYKDYPHEFIAYCLINKESNSGIFAHERLLVLDSYLQELRYYSTIPNLPLTNTEQLGNFAKETIKLSKVGKFSFIPVKNGIGQVTVSWKDGPVMKEWKISMGNRRMAKQFSILIDEVRKKEHLLKSQAKMFQSRISVQQNKVNLKTTPFIQQLTKLDQQQQSNGNKSKVNEIQQYDKTETAAVKVDIQFKKQIQTHAHHKQTITLNDGMAIKPQTSLTLQPEQQNLPESKKERAKLMPKSPKLQMKQIKINDVEMQYKQNMQNKEGPKKQQLSQLQRILKSRREELENSHLSNTQPRYDISMSKVLIRQTPSSSPPKPQTSIKNQIKNHLSPKTYHSQNEDNDKMFRLSLLSQRRQSYQSSAGEKIAITQQTHPISESGRVSKGASKNLKMEERHEWMYKWVTAKSSAQKADIYCKFVNHCKAKVLKIINTFQDWHLFRKSSKYQCQEQEVEYTFLMKAKNFRQDIQTIYKQNMANFDYIMTAFGSCSNDSQYSHTNNVLFAIPMICIVNYKCLMVSCKASQISTKISSIKILDRTKYLQKISKLQKYAKVTLEKSQIWEIQSNEWIWIYFKQLQALPFVDDQKSIYIDGQYLSRFIKDGVIKNSYDLLAINNHLKTMFPTLLQTLEQSCPLSTIQLEQIINQAGLNLSVLAVLYKQALQMQKAKAASILISQIMAVILAQYIRSAVQQQLISKNTDKANIAQWIFPLISQYLQKSQPIIGIIKDNLAQFLKVQNIAFPNNTIDEYVMSSLLLKLGLRCEVKVKMNIQWLESMQFQFWRQMQFCPQNINLVHVSQIITYHIQHFSQEWYSFIRNDFDKEKIEANVIQKEALFRLINIHPNRPYYESFIFQLMPKHHKIKLNFLLSLLTAPSESDESTFLSQFNNPYFNLCRHSTASIPTHYSFASDLAGLKWLIKKKQYKQVESKMIEQVQRVWMWARNNPKILMQIYDLNSLFCLIYKKAADSMANSLKSLQIAIYFFGKSSNDLWEVIWEKAYHAANIHYDLNKIEQALQLYSTCAQMIEKMPETKIKQCDIKQQLLDIYLKKSKLLINLGRIQDAVDQCKANMLKYIHWKSIFDPTDTQILSKIQCEEFETNLLQFRCYQIQNNAIQMIKIAEFCCISYIEKDFSEDSLSSSCCIETMKMMWTAIMSNANTSIEYNHYLHHCYPDFHKMDLNVLGDYLVASQIKRNTINQMSKQIQIALKSQSQINGSAFVKLTLQSLNQISKSKLLKPSTLNYETTKSKHLMFIKSFIRLIGEEFALGYIKSIVSQFGCC